MIILDTDILSIFAKSGEMPLLLEQFGNDMGMTPAITVSYTHLTLPTN